MPIGAQHHLLRAQYLSHRCEWSLS